MGIHSTSDNFARKFITTLRYAHNKEYRITWEDIKYLFGNCIDPMMITDMKDIWNSDKTFEWAIDDISEDFRSDFKRQKFLVDIAYYQMDDGKFAVLTIGGGNEKFSRNAILSFYNADALDPELIWRCQIQVDQRYGREKWQTGTIRMGWDEKNQCDIIESLHMKSIYNEKESEMIFNGNMQTPIYVQNRNSMAGSASGFVWDAHTDTIWNDPFDRHYENGKMYYTISRGFFCDFAEEQTEFAGDVQRTNPGNLC